MAVKVTVDYSRFRARLRRMREAGHTARSAFIFSMGQIFLQHVVKFSPVDTHRYVRGWLMASAEAGFKTTALPPLRKSKHHDVLKGLLERQIILTKRQITLEELKLAWYEDGDKLGRQRPKIGYYHKLVNKIYEAKERARRAAEEFEKFAGSETAIAMMRTSGAAMNGYDRNLRGNALQLTVRERVYGGRGRFIRGSTSDAMALHNLEPHCRAVEKWKRPVGRAKMALSAAGIKSLKPVYVNQMAKDTATSAWLSARGGRMRIR